MVPQMSHPMYSAFDGHLCHGQPVQGNANVHYVLRAVNVNRL